MPTLDSKPKYYENDSFLVAATQEPGCRLTVTVTIKPEKAGKLYKQAIKRVNKEISVPGFRKGKAPEEAVLKSFSFHVDQEWKDMLKVEALKGAFELSKIYPLSKETIEKLKVEKASLEEGALVTFSYEFYPIVPDIDFSTFTLSPPTKEKISDKRIDEVVAEIQKSHADFEPVEGRAVQEGDYADVSIDAIDQEPNKPIVKDRRFEVGGSLTPWLKQMLLGMEVEETREGVTELDEKAEERIKKAFRPTKVRIVLHAIKKIVLPPVDEEFAKKMKSESVEEMRKAIRRNLENEAEATAKEQQLSELEQLLLNAIEFDLPASLVEREGEVRLREKIASLREQLSDEEIRQKQTEIEAAVEKETNEALRLYFIEMKIEEQGKVSFTQKELNEELFKHLLLYAPEKKLDKEASKKLLQRVKEKLRRQKTREYALSQVLNEPIQK